MVDEIDGVASGIAIPRGSMITIKHIKESAERVR
jgi:hypothetical protein